MTVTPFLWFIDQAEQAAERYVSIFEGRPGGAQGTSRILGVSRYGEAGPGEPGSAMTVEFELVHLGPLRLHQLQLQLVRPDEPEQLGGAGTRSERCCVAHDAPP